MAAVSRKGAWQKLGSEKLERELGSEGNWGNWDQSTIMSATTDEKSGTEAGSPSGQSAGKADGAAGATPVAVYKPQQRCFSYVVHS